MEPTGYPFTSDERQADFAVPDIDIEVVELSDAEAAAWEYDCGGFFYVLGVPGRLWDGAPMGPYDSATAALRAARADAAETAPW